MANTAKSTSSGEVKPAASTAIELSDDELGKVSGGTSASTTTSTSTGATKPVETVTLNFTKINMEY